MAELTLQIPAVQDKFYADKDVDAIKKKLNTIDSKYGDIIDNIADITGLNAEIIKSFIFIESAGNETAHTASATGLMQVGTAPASDGLVFEKSTGRLGDEETALVKKYLGSRWSLLDKVKPKVKSIGKTFITKADLLKPEFNILIGSIIIKQLIDEFASGGDVRLDKVAVVYNTGRFSKTGKIAIKHTGTPAQLIAKIPSGQADYIRKLVGTNSLMDILSS